MIIQSANVNELIGSAGANSPGFPGLWTKASGFKEACFGRNARRVHTPAEPLSALGVLGGKKSVKIRVNPWFISTLVENSLHSNVFAQNEPNFKTTQIAHNLLSTKHLHQEITSSPIKKTNPNEPNFKIGKTASNPLLDKHLTPKICNLALKKTNPIPKTGKMQANPLHTNALRHILRFTPTKNKPNSNPIPKRSGGPRVKLPGNTNRGSKTNEPRTQRGARANFPLCTYARAL